MESQSENKKKNAGALRCYFIEIVAITSAYLIEVVKGNRTAGYIVLVCLLLWLPAIAAMFVYFKNKDAKAIRYLYGFGFLIPQAVLMLTANNALVFTYAILVLVTCNIFEDRKFALIMAISYNIMNILTVVYHIAAAGTTNDLRTR